MPCQYYTPSLTVYHFCASATFCPKVMGGALPRRHGTCGRMNSWERALLWVLGFRDTSPWIWWSNSWCSRYPSSQCQYCLHVQSYEQNKRPQFVVWFSYPFETSSEVWGWAKLRSRWEWVSEYCSLAFLVQACFPWRHFFLFSSQFFHPASGGFIGTCMKSCLSSDGMYCHKSLIYVLFTASHTCWRDRACLLWWYHNCFSWNECFSHLRQDSILHCWMDQLWCQGAEAQVQMCTIP